MPSNSVLFFQNVSDVTSISSNPSLHHRIVLVQRAAEDFQQEIVPQQPGKFRQSAVMIGIYKSSIPRKLNAMQYSWTLHL